jgi:IS1 family transposase/transposase-like protein
LIVSAFWLDCICPTCFGKLLPERLNKAPWCISTTGPQQKAYEAKSCCILRYAVTLFLTPGKARVICNDCGTEMKKFGFFGKERIQRYRCKNCGQCRSDIPDRPLDTMRVPFDKAVQIVNMLVEGISVRATARLSGVHRDTVLRVLEMAGEKCILLHDKMMRDLPCKVLQVDEIWSFCQCKEINVPEDLKGKGIKGDMWTWVAIDSVTKLVPSWHVGNRDALAASRFVEDVKSRLAGRVQLTSDGLKLYASAVEASFGSEIDYAMLIKLYGREFTPESRYSPPVCIGARKRRITGNPIERLVSTSHVERSNLSMRMGMRRFTRLTNGFSKKAENHKYMVALYFAYYNFCRIHGTLRVTPAMEVGIAKHVWATKELLEN